MEKAPTDFSSFGKKKAFQNPKKPQGRKKDRSLIKNKEAKLKQ